MRVKGDTENQHNCRARPKKIKLLNSMSQGIAFTCSILVDVSCPLTFFSLSHRYTRSFAQLVHFHRGILGPADDCYHFRRHIREAVSREAAFMHGLKAWWWPGSSTSTNRDPLEQTPPCSSRQVLLPTTQNEGGAWSPSVTWLCLVRPEVGSELWGYGRIMTRTENCHEDGTRGFEPLKCLWRPALTPNGMTAVLQLV